MKALTAALVFGLGIAGLLTALGLSPVHAVTTTTTVIGWLIPDGMHWNNGIGALLYPLIGIVGFAAIAKVAGSDSGFGVTLILMGIVTGAILATLSVTGSGTNQLPFALIVVPAADLVIWMWRGNE